MILKRLDISIITQFELFYDDSTSLPTYRILYDFLLKNCMALDNLSLSAKKNVFKPQYKKSDYNSKTPSRPLSLMFQTDSQHTTS